MVKSTEIRAAARGACWDYQTVAEHECPDCGRFHSWKNSTDGRCFHCSNAHNPFLGIGMRIETGSEDSTDPARVADGTSRFNMGLPGVETVVGTRADGQPKLAYRPVSNNELATARARREYAKRHGLEPKVEKTFRAVGGK
ncbi:MAG: hypothetical protein KGL39_49255 [Patescibacteria group bacterium]|nr:hypothetical protein [Patescibacteria group bacterium]